MSKQVLQQLPDGVYTFEDWQYTQAIILRNGELSVYVGGTEAARLELGDMRLCKLVEVDDAASVPSDEVRETIQGLLEAGIAGTESTIRTRKYHNLPTFATPEEEWQRRYKAALAWLASVAPQSNGDTNA